MVNESHINTNQTRKKVVKVAAILFSCPTSIVSDKPETSVQVSVIENICWKELGILVSVWILILALQIGKVSVLFL